MYCTVLYCTVLYCEVLRSLAVITCSSYPQVDRQLDNLNQGLYRCRVSHHDNDSQLPCYLLQTNPRRKVLLQYPRENAGFPQKPTVATWGTPAQIFLHNHQIFSGSCRPACARCGGPRPLCWAHCWGRGRRGRGCSGEPRVSTITI